MEGQKRNHKPGLGTSDSATDRHVATSRQKTKKNRERKLMKKRKPAAVQHESMDITVLVAQLSPTLNSMQDLKDLDIVLKHGIAAEPYFAASNMYDCQRGPPWIFPENTQKLQELRAILHSTTDVETLRVASNCLINITSHEDCEWTLACIPMLPVLFHVLKTCTDTTVREHVYWTMANMCMDKQTCKARDLILSNGIVELIVSQVGAEDWILLQVVAYLFKSLFITHPLPDIHVVAPLWHKLIVRLSEAPETMVDDLYDAVLLMMKSRRPEYKMAIILDETFWPHLISMRNMQCIRILATLSHSMDTIEVLVDRGVIALYVQMLNHHSPEARAEGGLGLSNLAESGKVTARLFQPDILNAVQRQLRYTDVFRVRKQVYWFMCSLAKHVSDEHLDALVERGYVKYFVEVLRLPDENTLKARALRALYRFTKVCKKATHVQLEENEADYILNNLTTDEDLEIQDLALKLLDVQDSTTEFSERFELTTSQMNFTF